jgi:hypothetical protein
MATAIKLFDLKPQGDKEERDRFRVASLDVIVFRSQE